MAVLTGVSIVVIGILCRLLWFSHKRLRDCISDLENQINQQGMAYGRIESTVRAKTDRIEELVEILDRMQDERAAVVRWLREIPESLHQSSKYRETGTGCDEDGFLPDSNWNGMGSWFVTGNGVTEDESLSSTDQKCTM